MSLAQNKTHKNLANKKRRVSTEEKILNFLTKNNKVYTIHSLAIAMGEKYSKIQPRVSELITKGKILEVGESEGGTRIETKIRLSPNPGMFAEPKKTKHQLYKEAVKRMVDPETVKVIEEEFQRLRMVRRSPSTEKKERNLEMLRMSDEGYTYVDIGKKFDITSRRTGVIIKRYRILKSRNQL